MKIHQRSNTCCPTFIYYNVIITKVIKNTVSTVPHINNHIFISVVLMNTHKQTADTTLCWFCVIHCLARRQARRHIESHVQIICVWKNPKKRYPILEMHQPESVYTLRGERKRDEENIKETIFLQYYDYVHKDWRNNIYIYFFFEENCNVRILQRTQNTKHITLSIMFRRRKQKPSAKMSQCMAYSRCKETKLYFQNTEHYLRRKNS